MQFLPLAVCAATLLLFASPPAGARQTDSDLERLAQQMTQYLQATAPSQSPGQPASPGKTGADKEVEASMGQLGPDGRWPNIRYDDPNRGTWSPVNHIRRVQELARSYSTPGGALYQSPALAEAIHRALGAWLEKDYQSANWWYNKIGVPQSMAAILLLFQNELTPREKAGGLKIVARAEIGMTGQNRVWLAGITLMRGLLESQPDLIQQASDTISGEIVITEHEGIQPDYSFHQHGPQLQLGNYGMAFTSETAKYAKILRGTRFAFSEEKLGILRAYILEGERYVLWKGALDISSCGRQLFPDSPRKKCQSFLQSLETLKAADAAHTTQYDEAAAIASGRQQFTGNKFFWRSDYMVDRRAGYFASIKMNSPRVIGTELVNSENLQGYYLADGALYVYQSGGEYENIFPVWNWRKVPGVTCPQAAAPVPPSHSTPAERNANPFVGGVSDGRDGAAVLAYQRDGVTAKKSVFFLEGRIVCLGAGLRSEKADPLATSVAQSLLSGPVTVAEEGARPASTESRKEYAALKWAHHNAMGYVFPQPVRATVGGAPQQGTWKSVFSAGPSTAIEKEVFSLWIDHGPRPQSARYAYILLPGATATEVEAFAASPSLNILSNTETLQAIQSGGLLLAVFYQPGELAFEPGHKLAVDTPCAVLLRQQAPRLTLTVTDPTQKQTAVRVQLDGQPIAVPLPGGPKAGDSVTVEVKK